MSHCRMYLILASAFSLFRFIMYHLRHEYVTKVKITPVAWQNSDVRDIAFQYTAQIRLFMGFRALVYGWGASLIETPISCQLAYISLFVDIYLLLNLFSLFNGNKRSGIVKYQSKAPLYIQFTLVCTGILIFF